MAYDDPYVPQDDDEILQMLMQYQGSTLPGNTAAQQMNYYQDLTSTLGFDPVQQAGLQEEQAPPEQPYVPPVSKQRIAYGSNPLYVELFDRIDSGQDPITAYNEVEKSHAKDITWTDTLGADTSDAKNISTAAKDYAFERASAFQGEQDFQQKQLATQQKQSYTQPDGSKYKNTPLGGNDIYGTASEFDLLGQPDVDVLLKQFATQNKGFAPQVQMQNAGPQKRYPKTGGGGGERSYEQPQLQVTNRSYVGGTAQSDAAARQATKNRIKQSQATRVRSDANTNAMRRILALRTILGA